MSKKVMGLAVIAAVALVGCGLEAPNSNNGTAPIVVHSVQINPLFQSVEVGTDTDFIAFALNSDGSAAVGESISWSSLTPTIATVDQNGHCETLLVGQAVIKATLDSNPLIYTTAVVHVTPLPPPPCDITTLTLPAGTVGTAYSAALSHTGGSGPELWTISVGALPGGLTINPNNGTIAGVPTVAGVFNFTVRLEQGSVATRPLSITINSSGGGPRVGPILVPANPGAVDAAVGAAN